jgi:small subunit ribosomal protein S8
MSMNDPLGDMLARIRNASMRGKSTVRTPASKIRKWVLDVLQSEGYIRGYDEVKAESGHAEIEISLKYYDGQPVIRELRRVSTPAGASTPA